MANGKFDLTKTLGESSYIYSRCEWSSSGKTETNKSTMDIRVIVGKRSGSNTPTSCTFNTTVSVSGAESPSSQSNSPYDSVSANEEIVVFEGTFVVPHDDNGKKSTAINVSIGNNNVYHASGSSTITLDTIPRASSIAVSNYDLGQNISITIGKKVDSFTSTLTYKIGSRTGTIIEKTKEPSCVWEMSDELISQIKQDNPKNAKPTATIYCETYSGNTKIGDTKSATFNLYITDKPELTNISKNEACLDIQELTNSVLKHVSIINVNAEAEAPEGTTISNYKLKWGNIEKNSSDGVFLIDNIQYSYLDENGNRKTKFTVIATDERGNSSDGFFSSEEYPYTCDFIEYIQLAFNNTDIKLTRLNGTSNYMKLHMTGYVYNGLFGETQNTLTIKYRYKLKNDSTAKWSELKDVEVTMNDDNTFTIDNVQLEDEFDYKENYDVEFYANDLFSTAVYSTVIKTSETIAKWHKKGAYIKEVDTEVLKIKNTPIPQFSCARMVTNFEIKNITSTSHVKTENWKVDFEYGDYSIDTINHRIVIKNTKILNLSGLICGNGYVSTQYRVFEATDEKTEIEGNSKRQTLFQYGGNGYFQTPLSNMNYELNPEKTYYVYLYVATYNNGTFAFNNGFGANGTWIQALKLL